MNPRDHFQWIDPADAIFVTACREALKIERAAYAAADAERRVLWARLEGRELAGEPCNDGARRG